jgi:hypothetical protein
MTQEERERDYREAVLQDRIESAAHETERSEIADFIDLCAEHNADKRAKDALTNIARTIRSMTTEQRRKIMKMLIT